MKIGDGCYFGDSVWVICAIIGQRVYIRPPHQGEIPTAPFHRVATHNQDGSERLSLSLYETKPEQQETAHAQPARKRARKQPCPEQLSLFDSGGGEGL